MAEPQPLADKIRQHFLNRNYSYRTPVAAVDLDSSSDTSFDLSASFEQEIQSRHRMNTAKSNDTPGTPSTLRQPEAASQQSNADTSINRMFTGFGLSAANRTTEFNLMDVTEPSMFERLSPCKRVGVTRPSTVLEEESNPSTSPSFQTAFASEKPSEGSFGTASSAADSDGSLEYTRDSLRGVSLAAGHHPYDEDSLDTSTSEAAALVTTSVGPALALSIESPRTRDYVPDDTLEDVEYDHNGSRYLLKPVRKTNRLSSVVSISSDSSPLKADDEIIDLDDIESDTDTSYKTANTHAKTERESLSKSAEGSEGMFPNLSRSFYDDDDNGSGSMQNEIDGNKSRSIEGDKSNVISLIDSDDENLGEPIDLDEEEGIVELEDVHTSDGGHNEENRQNESMESEDHNQLAQPPNLSPDSGRSSHELSVPDEAALEPSMMPDEFNDTIERMEFMIEHGRRIAEAQRSAVKKTPVPSPLLRTPNVIHSNTDTRSSPLITPSNAASHRTIKPPAKQQLFGTPISKNSPILKAKSTNPPVSKASQFKKPMPFKSLTPAASHLKKSTPLSGSRIPKPHSASKLPSYDYIRSPIGAYISQRAPNPTRQNLQPNRDFLDSTYCANAPRGLDFTLPTDQVAQPKHRFPRKIFIQATEDKIVDRRTHILPGDQNVLKLIGSRATLIRCRGMSAKYPPPLQTVNPLDEFGADFLSNFEVVTGDQNVLEVFDG